MVRSVMINVTEEEFERAKAFFNANPDEIKFHGKGEKNGLGKSGEQLRESFFKKAGSGEQIEVTNEKTAGDKPKTESPKEMNALDVPHISPVTPIRNLKNLREPPLNRSASLSDLDKNTNNQPTRPRSNST